MFNKIFILISLMAGSIAFADTQSDLTSFQKASQYISLMNMRGS